MENSSLNDALLRLVYALEEYKDDKKTTLVLGAGCSLDSTENDISTMGIMKACLYDHQAVLKDENSWEEVYEAFINIVWTGKSTREKRALLNKHFQNMEPTNAHIIIKELIQKGYIHNIITTNFDLLIEESCKNITYFKKVGDEDFVKIGEGKALFNLLKIHGDLERGELRFSPSELKKLPNNLEEEINKLTKRLTLFLGYRGQDIGLMNSINKTDTSSVYWINISGPLNQKHFESEQIKDLLYMRESGENLLYGKEYGDFQNFFQILNQFLILKNHANIIESTKRHILSNWNGTSIIDMLSINTKIFNLFANLLYCSEKTSSENVERNDKYYTYLNSYLYLFKNKILPSKLITIPHNEIDSLILGLLIEIMARAQSYSIYINKYIDNLKQEFEKK